MSASMGAILFNDLHNVSMMDQLSMSHIQNKCHPVIQPSYSRNLTEPAKSSHVFIDLNPEHHMDIPPPDCGYSMARLSMAHTHTLNGYDLLPVTNKAGTSPKTGFLYVNTESENAASMRSSMTQWGLFNRLYPLPVRTPYGFVVLGRSVDGSTLSWSGVFSVGNITSIGVHFGPLPEVGSAELIASENQEMKGCGWMMHISTTPDFLAANLMAARVGQLVYLYVVKQIPAGAEVLLYTQPEQVAASGLKPPQIFPKEIDTNLEFDDNGFKCEQCGKVFAYGYYRDKHQKYTSCVDNGDRKFPCNLCSRSFEKRDRLRIHVLHVHEKHRPHKCKVCLKQFSQSSSLNKHMRVHSGERPYQCLFCGKVFTASSILRTHIRQHSGEKPFKCKYCGKAFASHAAHDSHAKRTHSNVIEDVWQQSKSTDNEIIDVVG